MILRNSMKFMQLYIYKTLKNLYCRQHSAIFFLLFMLISVLIVSCSHSDVDRKKFIDAYIDLRVNEDTMRLGSKSIEDVKKEILKKHGLTEKQYEETFNYFSDNPGQWNQMYDEIIARVDTLRKKGK
jgi:hypothetical protein